MEDPEIASRVGEERRSEYDCPRWCAGWPDRRDHELLLDALVHVELALGENLLSIFVEDDWRMGAVWVQGSVLTWISVLRGWRFLR